VPATTVVDQLIVKLGLDPRDFDKGRKQAAAGVLETEQTVKKSAGGMSTSLTRLATKWLSVAGAILAVKKAVGVIDDVATRTRRLGIDARNYDIAAAGLRNFENAAEMFGGSAEEARRSVAGLNQAVFDLAYNGQMSDSLVMLARLGVNFQTSTGHAREFKDIVLDTADAIGRAQQKGMTRGEAYQYLQQSGFDQGTSQMILAGRAQAQAALAAQEKRRQISEGDVTKATGISQARIGKEQALEGVAVGAMEFAGGVQEGVNNFIEMLASPGGVNDALGALADKTKNLGNAFDEWSVKVSGISRGIRNNNPGNIRAVGDQNKDRQGFRVFRTMEEGIEAADEQLKRYTDKGVNTISKIITKWAPPSENDTQAYIDDVVKETGFKADEVIDSPGMRYMLMAAMFKHESGSGAPNTDDIQSYMSLKNEGLAGTGPTGATPTPAAQTGTTFNKTDVQVDSITIVTQAKDANGIAGEIAPALKRKMMAAHAEQGMQ